MKRILILVVVLTAVIGSVQAQDIIGTTIESWPPFMFKEMEKLMGDDT